MVVTRIMSAVAMVTLTITLAHGATQHHLKIRSPMTIVYKFIDFMMYPGLM